MTTQIAIGIDASSIDGGGGLTHLSNLLANAVSFLGSSPKVLVWGRQKTLDAIPDAHCITKRSHRLLERGPVSRSAWQRYVLSRELEDYGCDVLLTAGSSTLCAFRPSVVLSQNLLPFCPKERRRYGILSWTRYRLWILRYLQMRSFTASNAVIFLTEESQRIIEADIGYSFKLSAVVPHGVSNAFLLSQRTIRVSHSPSTPFRLLYVSTVDRYKHQTAVAQSVLKLHSEGYSLQLSLIGTAYPPSLTELNELCAQHDQNNAIIQYTGSIPYREMPSAYSDADIFIFASSCENMPNILLEAMAVGLPIACSSYSPMPEILGDAGIYFNPTDTQSITNAIRTLLNDQSLCQTLSDRAKERAHKFKWRKTAQDTFQFLTHVFQSKNQFS